MVPIRAFTDVIGAHLMYKSETKMLSVSLLGQSVGNIQPGKTDAVFGGDMGFSLGAEPVLRNGMLFVPATPILQELKFSWEAQNNNVNKPTLGIKPPYNIDVLLGRIEPPVDVNLYPTETTRHSYPLYPSMLTQEKSDREYKLTLTVQNITGSVIEKGSTELEVICVDNQGNAVLPKLAEPGQSISKAARLTFDFWIPTKSEYVLFRSRIVR